MSDSDDYGFEYSDDDYAEEDVDIENQYYNAKGCLESNDVSNALVGFLEILDMEDDQGEWGFKALKQIVKLHYRMNEVDKMLESYKKLLEYSNSSSVTRNAAEKKINSTLEFVSHSTDPELLHKFYSLTLQGLADAKNERLWFKTSIKLANLWISMGEEEKAMGVLDGLKERCSDGAVQDDSKRGTQLLEVYALQIQLLSNTLMDQSEKETNRDTSSQIRRRELVQETYEKALAIKSAIPHPRIMGIIREYGGKMHMYSGRWEQAATDFFEAFKAYDEAGSTNRSKCLKYLVLANMMMESEVDPFDSQEARPYKSDPGVVAMTNLVESYQASNIEAFEREVNHDDIARDSFVAPYINDLRRNLCSKVILMLIAPYTRIKIDHIREFLSVGNASVSVDVDELLISLILDGKLQGRIDQVDNVLVMEKHTMARDKFLALKAWADSLQASTEQIAKKLTV